MDKFKTLTGEELVALGAKKVNCSLPELGLKDVVPNGSWLEQKQVQNALEARRHIVEVERIEKSGTLSQAEWDEKLNLAEVSKMSRRHWQYVGHNVGRTLYLYPEEALLLMEMNCLRLTHNGVTVSIQQAYTLLLKDNISLVQYKVYASLSRIGYKVLRHDMNYVKDTEKEDIDSTTEVEQPSSSDSTLEEADITDELVENKESEENKDVIHSAEDSADNKMNNAFNAETTIDSNQINELCDKTNENVGDENIDAKTGDNIVSVKDEIENDRNEHNTTTDIKENCLLNDVETIQMETENTNENVEVCSSVNLCDDDSQEVSKDTIKIVSIEISDNRSIAIIQNKIDILSTRELRPCDSSVVHECFNENLPDLYQKHIVTVKAPEEKYIPRNVFLNNTAYVLNLENLKLKSVTPVSSTNTGTYSIPDEANEQHVRRIRSGYSNESAQSNLPPQFLPRMRFPQSHQYRPFNYWNQFNWTYQRPFFQMPFRFQVFPRMQPMYRFFPTSSMFPNAENATRRPTKRKRDNPKKYHLESIRHLASKLKGLVASGNRQEGNIQALQRLIDTYNTRYRTRLELTEQLDILENEIILDTIDLDDDDQTQAKKKKNADISVNMYDENFEAVKKLAAKLKDLEAKNFLSARHRRAFSNVIKTFNKSYNADIYVDSHYEVIDRRHIVIPSSSDSECTVEEMPTVEKTTPKRRRSTKLRNPFFILKQLSEKQNSTVTSLDLNESSQHLKKKFEYSDLLRSVFSKDWLPSEDDFGRAEVPLKSQTRQMDHSENFLYEFMKSQPVQFNNWLNAKIAYWQSCKDSALKFEAQSQSETKIKLDSIVNVEDCTDLRSVLKKLSVIKTSKDVQEECSLTIHFDVYQRDVPNFRKSKKPKPHFRIICIEETSPYPTGQEFATLHSKYTDDVGIVFAIVGTSSISFLQIIPEDLPIYIPTTNMP